MNLIKTHFLKDDERLTLYIVNEVFKSRQRKLIEYNSNQKTFTFQGLEWDADFDIDGLGGASPVFSKPPYTISMSKVEQTMSISENKPRKWELIKPEIINELKKLIKIGRVKSKILQKISEERYSELKNLTKAYIDIGVIHDHISRYQNDLRTTLNAIIEGKNLYNNKIFENYLAQYSSGSKIDIILQPDGSFSYDSDFLKEEKYYLENTPFIFDPIFEDSGYASHSLAVAYCLIEFVLNYDRRKLKKCSYCNEFYIQAKLYPKQKYCSNCSSKSKMSKEKRREYQRNYRQKKREQERALQREARIKKFVNAGWTRKEAEEIIEADSMM
jgi:hypothetical protein